MLGNRDELGLSRSSASRASKRDAVRESVSSVMESRIRRHVLGCLDETSGTVELSELAAELADSTDEGSADRVAVMLHHNHLPKLADLGLLEYDHRTNSVVGTVPSWAGSDSDDY